MERINKLAEVYKEWYMTHYREMEKELKQNYGYTDTFPGFPHKPRKEKNDGADKNI